MNIWENLGENFNFIIWYVLSNALFISITEYMMRADINYRRVDKHYLYKFKWNHRPVVQKLIEESGIINRISEVTHLIFFTSGYQIESVTYISLTTYSANEKKNSLYSLTVVNLNSVYFTLKLVAKFSLLILYRKL